MFRRLRILTVLGVRRCLPLEGFNVQPPLRNCLGPVGMYVSGWNPPGGACRCQTITEKETTCKERLKNE